MFTKKNFEFQKPYQTTKSENCRHVVVLFWENMFDWIYENRVKALREPK